MSTVDHLIEDAHKAATDVEAARMAAELQELLGQKLVAFAVGNRHPKNIGRYARGDRFPEPDTLGRLVDLYTVVEILRRGMRDPTIKTWMMGTNPRLQGKAPIEVLHERRAYDVMGAARAFVTRRLAESRPSRALRSRAAMQRPAFGFDGYATVPPPPDGFWRVTDWREPFDPPPPAPPLGASPQDDDGHRYDDPDGVWRTLYCASEAEGALGECLGDFKFNPQAAVRIAAYLESEPDEGFDESLFRPLTAADVEGFRWLLAHAPATAGAVLIDVDNWRTYNAVAPRAVPALVRYGVKHLDRKTVLEDRRPITRTLAGVYRRDATDLLTGEMRAAGLRFTSRLPPAWQCWALWEPLPLRTERATVERVTVDLPQLRVAAEMLGVAIER